MARPVGLKLEDHLTDASLPSGWRELGRGAGYLVLAGNILATPTLAACGDKSPTAPTPTDPCIVNPASCAPPPDNGGNTSAYATFSASAMGLVSGQSLSSGSLTIYGAKDGGGDVVLPISGGSVTATAEHKLKPGSYDSRLVSNGATRTSRVTVSNAGVSYNIGEGSGGINSIDGLNSLVNEYVFWPTNVRFTGNQTVYVFDRSNWTVDGNTYTKVDSNPMAQWKINEIRAMESEGLAGIATGGVYSDNFVYESQNPSIDPNTIGSGIVLVPINNTTDGISKSNHTTSGNTLVRVDLGLGNFTSAGLRIDYVEAWGYKNPGGSEVIANPALGRVKYGRSPSTTAPDNTP